MRAGKLLWTFNLGGQGGWVNMCSGPAIGGDRSILFAGDNQDLRTVFAIEPMKGSLVWSFKLEGSGGALAAVGRTVYVVTTNPDSYATSIVALRDGSKVWVSPPLSSQPTDGRDC